MSYNLSKEQRDIIAKEYVNGEQLSAIAKSHELSEEVIVKLLKKCGVWTENKVGNVSEFANKARSILWRVGSDREQYETWRSRIDEIIAKKNYSQSQAIIIASKEVPILRQLFLEYDLRKADPEPDSHPGIYGITKEITEVVNLGIKQTHRANIDWAAEAAGRTLRTKEEPSECPNDASYFLYVQAVGQPKDFMARYAQIAVKGSEEERDAEFRQSGKASIGEITEMLDFLQREEADTAAKENA